MNENKIESVMKTNEKGNKYWVIPDTEKYNLSFCGYGILNKEDGPAIETRDGSKFWYIYGKKHREDGPAVEWNDGNKEWFRNGFRHREDGPAIEYINGIIEWYLNNQKIKPTIKMMSKYIQLNPDNIFKDYEWPKEIQALAIELGGEKIKDRLIKENKIHPTPTVPGLEKLDRRGFFS